PPVHSLHALVPDAFVHWMDRMMAKRVNRRPRTALEALETLEQLHEAALTGGVAPAPRGVESWEDTTEQHTRPAEGHLPRPSTSFVGRHHPLEQLDHLVVELQERCVTLHGMGGLGKSRLAVEWARSQRHQWPGGAWFCALAQVRSEEGILIALAQLLGVQLSQEPMEQLCDVLRDLGQALLILDNVEQLTAPMSAVLSRWLEAAPELTVLLTSRRPLGLEGEQVLALQPLELPPTALSVKRVEGESMELFWDRAKAVCPDWEQTPELMADIARLVRQLDGLPLAIELAAARCRVMSPGSMLQRLDQRFKLLRSRSVEMDPRQAALKATLDWSWNLLHPYQKSVLVQCALFQGPFSVEAAETVVSLDRCPERSSMWVMDVLQELVETSLVRALDPTRYSLFVSVRAYAHQHLLHPEEEVAHLMELKQVERRYIAYFAAYGQPRFLEQLDRDRRPIHELEAELGNLRNAFDLARERGLFREAGLCALAMGTTFSKQGPYAQGLELLQEALELPLSESTTVNLRLCIGLLHRGLGQIDQAQAQVVQALELARRQNQPRLHAAAAIAMAEFSLLIKEGGPTTLQEALDLTESLGDPDLRGHALLVGGLIALWQGDAEGGMDFLHTALELARRVGNKRLESLLLRQLGTYHASQAQWDAALSRLQEAWLVAQRQGDKQLEAAILYRMGRSLAGQHNPKAHAIYKEGRRLAQRIGDRYIACYFLEGFGDLAYGQHQWDKAFTWYHQCLQSSQQLQDKNLEFQARMCMGNIRLQQGRLTEAHQFYEENLIFVQQVNFPFLEFMAYYGLWTVLLESG
ncbi:MAG: NB-ARC domain-containing protein, partial [Myxococcota bacterium]